MTRFTGPKSPVPPRGEPTPGELPVPLGANSGPTPGLLRDDLSRDDGTPPVAQKQSDDATA
jgi:hypothetical protein